MSYSDEKQRLRSLLDYAMLSSGNSNKDDERISYLSGQLADLEQAEKERASGEPPLSDREKLNAKYGVPYTNKDEWKIYRARFPKYGLLKVCFIFHRAIRIDEEELEVIVWREQFVEDKRYKAFFNTSLSVDRNEKVDWTELTKEEFVSGSIVLGDDLEDVISKLNSSNFEIPNFFTTDIPGLRQTLLHGFQAVMKFPNEL